jgi:hypothetical protein
MASAPVYDYTGRNTIAAAWFAQAKEIRGIKPRDYTSANVGPGDSGQFVGKPYPIALRQSCPTHDQNPGHHIFSSSVVSAM